RTPVPVAGLLLPGPGKIRTLNAAFPLAVRLGAAGVGWVDDDVVMDPDCLERMADAFLAGGCRGAVGPHKIAHAGTHRVSRLLHRAKAVAAPATNYPHGCCVLVATDVVADGIPDRYDSDDGYLCFALLDPAHPDPLHDLRLLPEARLHYTVSDGPAGPTRRRVRRLLLCHHIHLADAPYPAARYYVHHMLFPGMWPLTGWDGSRGFRHGAANAAVKWLYFGWFLRTGAELYVRGLLDRPLRAVAWSGHTTLAAPPRPAAPAAPAASGPEPKKR
ncbi:hypothetical protein ACFU99_28615, partial [Streptomyces sp. NPDC057654]